MAEKNSLKFLTASEARETTKTSHALKNRVYRDILEGAKENRCTTNWYISDYDQDVVNNLIKDLRSNGYEVSYATYLEDNGTEVEDRDQIIIKW